PSSTSSGMRAGASVALSGANCVVTILASRFGWSIKAAIAVTQLSRSRRSSPKTICQDPRRWLASYEVHAERRRPRACGTIAAAVAQRDFLPAGPTASGHGDAAETRAKLGTLREAMAAARLAAVYLETWANVAWLCGGRGNRVVADSPAGLCAVLVTDNGAWLLTPNNEEARLTAEVFGDLPLPVVSR